jgi:hypothetical protein
MPLSGSELIEALSKLPASASRGGRCRTAGYVTRLRDGRERLNFAAFYEALATACGSMQGLSLAAPERETQQPRRLSYRMKAGKPGAMLGAAYLAQIGAAPGDMLQIEVQDGSRIVVTICNLSEPA